jgi:hypothetical protein
MREGRGDTLEHGGPRHLKKDRRSRQNDLLFDYLPFSGREEALVDSG